VNPGALKLVITANLKRHPLWKVKTIEDFFDLSRAQVMAKIENGEFPWAFNIATGARRSEPRVLGYCVMKKTLGPFDGIGATRNLELPEVINFILPKRDIRSTELKRLLSCDQKHVYNLAPNFTVTKKPAAKDGPHSFTVFSRASVARFLQKRRMA